MQTKVSICFVEVIYGQKYNETKTFKSIISLLPYMNKFDFHILLYDNSPKEQRIEECCNIYNLTYFHDSRNIGVMAAYQYALDYCERKGIDWMLRLDQDSSFGNLLIEDFYSAQLANKECAVVVPLIYDKNNLISPTYVNKGGLYSSIKEDELGTVNRPITYLNSMSFVKVSCSAVKEALSTAKYMLDLSDHEFAYKIPMHLVYVMNTKVQHELSVMNIESINAKRYASLLCNEISFIRETQGALGKSIYFARVIIRCIKLAINRRYDLMSLVLKSILKEK